MDHPEHMRPDLCGAIHINRGKYDIIIPVGPTIPEETKEYFIQWSIKHNRPMIIKEVHVVDDEVFTAITPIGSKEFRAVVLDAAGKGEGFK